MKVERIIINYREDENERDTGEYDLNFSYKILNSGQWFTLYRITEPEPSNNLSNHSRSPTNSSSSENVVLVVAIGVSPFS